MLSPSPTPNPSGSGPRRRRIRQSGGGEDNNKGHTQGSDEQEPEKTTVGTRALRGRALHRPRPLPLDGPIARGPLDSGFRVRLAPSSPPMGECQRR
ncbi:hypothetical protein CDD83_9968 [Cordyceps sp. RAO-2017]|nr:hypothetical protein CDD83_9968 [Cordyceps sp. RAO-2017]